MGYSPDEHRPLRGYVALSGTFGLLAAGGVAAVARRGFPERVPLMDVALLGAATHQLARLITKDRVTSWVRAPFTRYQGPAGEGEVDEEARGEGLQLAIGELLICPYCLGQWVAAGFVVGYGLNPDATRFLAAIWATHAASDALQQLR